MIPLLLPVAIFVSCSKAEEPEESIRDRVVAASRGYREPAEMGQQGSSFFARSGFAEAFYSDDWVVDDPFTDSTRFFQSCSLVSHSYPYSDTHQALARSLKSEQQVFFVVGSDPMLKTRLDERTNDWASEAVSGLPDSLRSADGLDLAYRIFHIRPGLLSGEELLLEVAFLERNGMLLLLDAGLSYGRNAGSGQLLAEPQIHATLPQLVPVLRLQDLIAG